MGTIAVVAIICFMLGRLYGLREAAAITRLRANRNQVIRQNGGSGNRDRVNNQGSPNSRVRTTIR